VCFAVDTHVLANVSRSNKESTRVINNQPQYKLTAQSHQI